MEIISGAGKASINPVASANVQGNTRSAVCAVQALPAHGCWHVICTQNDSAKMNLTDGGGRWGMWEFSELGEIVHGIS